MMTCNTSFRAAGLAGLLLVGAPADSDAQGAGVYTRLEPPPPAAATASGAIRGHVRDESGAPVAGVLVSAAGASRAYATTDRNGRYELPVLRPGSYRVQAELKGYAPSAVQVVEVRSSVRSTSHISLRRASASPRIVTAGVGALPQGEAEPAAGETSTDPPQTEDERLWRLRHPARRSVLKDSTMPELWGDGAAGANSPWDDFGLTTATRWATAFFADTPLSGEVNFLTSGSFYLPEQLLSSELESRRIAYVSVNVPLANADWNVRGAVNQADISSWVVAGSYKERDTGGHRYHLGLSYSTQRYDGGNPLALRDEANGSRNVGEIYAFDTIALTPAITASYGARYGRYDYLVWRDLFSPRVELTIAPRDNLRLSALVSRTAVAPGAEEFLPPESGLWLPPQRTFSALEPGRALNAERTMHASVALARDIGAATVGVRGFHQRVDDQLVTLFGTAFTDDPVAPVGHYRVGSGGHARASGVAANIETMFAPWLRTVVEYSSVNAVLRPDETLKFIVLRDTSDLDGGVERIHNLSGLVDADFSETATRLQIVYRLSNGFTGASDRRDGAVSTRPIVDTRFDVQIRQALPFMNFSAAKWEMLFAVRNFVRESRPDQSVYDELLVVRPPKRVVGGLTLLF